MVWWSRNEGNIVKFVTECVVLLVLLATFGIRFFENLIKKVALAYNVRMR